ncbi:FecCD family ABC transporter permease [Pseudolysinimonas sp.]|uniref:FecCD family ABC transporter permease n=1 Tax=Pseudolysinimonas sp. TaxID=2680009 RepID=UPI0037850F22
MKRVVVGLSLAALLIAGILGSALLGQLPVQPTEVIGSLLRAVGIPNDWAPDDPIIESALWIVRFPRILMAIVVGAALAAAGAVMQAIFGNPLAEPGVVGVSSGAALGAATAIVLGLSAFGDYAIALFAFVGGLLATLLVYFVSRANGRTEVVTLLLTGIAVNAFASAGLAFALFAASTASREQIIFWQLGSLNGALWNEVLVVAVVAVIGVAVAVLLGRRYDLLSLGERNARHLGLDVERLRLVSIVVVALLTGVAVAFVGIIAFVGLVVPHVVRMLLGPQHRSLIVYSAFGGAVLMLAADLLARTIVPGAELPIGMLTSLVGGPFFFFLLWRQRRRSGGWA